MTDSQAPISISLEGLSKSFGNAVALQPTDLAVRQGEFLTLLGPSGSGKSTLLNLIAGAIAPSSGKIMLDGRDLTNVPPRDRGIGMVFQNYALMPHMTVFDNVAYPLRTRRVPSAEIKTRVMESIERVGLKGFEDRKPRQLSGGQQQRVGIARCIVYSPEIIMMDEPLGALDKKLREQMQGEIKRLHQEMGTTFIYVTHDQEEALNLSDRVCLMNVGEIAQLGTPDELYFEPNSKYVAGFIGESNMMEGTAQDGNTLKIDSGDVIHVPTFAQAAGTRLAAMVRPERLHLVHAGAADAASTENRITGKVTEIAFVGSTTRLMVQAAGGMEMLVATISETSTTRAAIGDEVTVGWLPENTVILDK